MNTPLAKIKCIPCKEGAPKLTQQEIKVFKKNLNKTWKVRRSPQMIERLFTFKDFKSALAFVNKIGELAEKEDHHPNIRLFNYKFVEVSLWTHKIGGLHKNDFILAAKIDLLKK